jgi:hypothetical protein
LWESHSVTSEWEDGHTSRFRGTEDTTPSREVRTGDPRTRSCLVFAEGRVTGQVSRLVVSYFRFSAALSTGAALVVCGWPRYAWHGCPRRETLEEVAVGLLAWLVDLKRGPEGMVNSTPLPQVGSLRMSKQECRKGQIHCALAESGSHLQRSCRALGGESQGSETDALCCLCLERSPPSIDPMNAASRRSAEAVHPRTWPDQVTDLRTR